MNITAVLGESLTLVRKHLVLSVPLLAFFVVVVLLSLLIMGTMFPFGTAQDLGQVTREEAVGIAGLTFLTGFIVLLISSFIGLLVMGMTTVMVDEAQKGEKPTLKDAWKKTMEKMVALLISSLIVSIIVSIGFVFLALPGLIAIFFLMFTIPTVMLEEANAFQAIGRGVKKVVSNARATIVLFLVLIALGVLFGILTVILGLIPILGVILTMIVSAIYAVYANAFLVLSYKALEPAPENPPEAKA